MMSLKLKVGTWILCACASLAAAGNPADSLYGVCAHLNRMPARERKGELELMAKTGIRFFRTDLDWAQVEKTPGNWNFAEWDDVVREAKAFGLQPLAILGGNLPGHSSPPFRNMEAWKRYVETVVKRYRNDIFHYEVINEADCDRPWGMKPDAENYTALLRETCAIIKRINPEATVLFTGVSDFQNPLPFVEKALKAGAGNCFDVMNFHPYQWKNYPEAQLRRRIQDLRAVMEKYHCRKPVWITEIGNSTAPFPSDFARAVIPAALKELGFDPARMTVATIADPVWFYYTDGFNMGTPDFLPETKKREFTFRELGTLDVRQYPVLILPGTEAFPMAVFPAVREYVKRGGTVVIAGGLPFYFNLERLADGSFRKGQINKQALPQLHIAWETFWTKPGVPAKTSRFEPGEKFPELKPVKREALRFLTKENLKPGDEMIPLVYGVEGDYKAPVAAIYRLNSDLKGNLVLITNVEGFESAPELEQAKLLPRQYLLSAAEGVRKVFWYRLRAGEWNRGREAHFGIYRRNFQDKPGALAYRAMTGFLPDGSTKPVLTVKGPVYSANWSRPDGTRVYALWCVRGKSEIKPKIRGTVREIRDYLGDPVELRNGTFTVSDGITYLVGNHDLSVELP